jgi:hypothetical protein
VMWQFYRFDTVAAVSVEAHTRSTRSYRWYSWPSSLWLLCIFCRRVPAFQWSRTVSEFCQALYWWPQEDRFKANMVQRPLSSTYLMVILFLNHCFDSFLPHFIHSALSGARDVSGWHHQSRNYNSNMLMSSTG